MNYKFVSLVFIIAMMLIVPVNSLELNRVQPLVEISGLQIAAKDKSIQILKNVDYRPVDELRLDRKPLERVQPKFEIDPSVLPKIPELRIADALPEVLIISNKESVNINEEFELIITATDNTGLFSVKLFTKDEVIEFNCRGEKSCTKKAVLSEKEPGNYSYKAYAKDIYGWDAEDSINLEVKACADSDNDLVCDDIDQCVGENPDNLPKNTACINFYFDTETGCHASIFDDGTTVCDHDYGVDYECKDGVEPGMDVFKQSLGRYCGVNTGQCDGEVKALGDFVVEDDCSSTEICEEDSPFCNAAAPIEDLEALATKIKNIDPSKYAGSDVQSFLHGDLVEATVSVRNNWDEPVYDVFVKLMNSLDEEIDIQLVDLAPGETKEVKFEFVLDALSCGPGNTISTCDAAVDYARNYDLIAEISGPINDQNELNDLVEADRFTALSFKHHIIINSIPAASQAGQIQIKNRIPDLRFNFETDQNIDIFKWIKLDLRSYNPWPQYYSLAIDHSSVGCTDTELCDGLGPEFNTFTCGSYSAEELEVGRNNDQYCYLPAVSSGMSNIHYWIGAPVPSGIGTRDFPVVVTFGNHPDDQIQLDLVYYVR